MWLLDQIRIRLFDKKDEEAQMETLKTAKWPEDKGLILHALESRNGLFRAQAVSLLPYEGNREQFARLAKEDMDDVVRSAAAEQLRYPEDRDLLVDLASYDAYHYLVGICVKKLPWPEEKETLITLAKADNYPVFAVEKLDPQETLALLEELALHSPDPEGKRAAAEKLAYPASKAVLEQYVTAEYPPQHLERIVDKLAYPESREALIHVALNSDQRNARFAAVDKLPWPEERETIEAVMKIYGDAAAQRKMLEAGICPRCGKPATKATETIDGEACEVYRCETCGGIWQLA